MPDSGPFGFGPFTDGLSSAPPHPPGIGYGSLLDPESSATYGFSPYGGLGAIPTPFLVEGGYGGYGYGASLWPFDFGSSVYGADPDVDPPFVTSAVSLDGFRFEVFFSEPMLLDSGFLDPSNYTLTGQYGSAPVQILSVEPGISTSTSANSAVITTSGTTLGGLYRVFVNGVSDTSLNPIETSAGANQADFLAKGYTPEFTVTPGLSGRSLLLEFDQDILPETGYSPGVEDVGNYAFSTEYPVDILAQSAGLVSSNTVELDVFGMTSVEYLATVGPALAFLYRGDEIPSESEDFEGIEFGVGVSTVTASGLRMEKGFGDAYAWVFLENPNVKILPESNYDVEIEFDASAGFTPDLNPDIAFSISVSDGMTQVAARFSRGADGTDLISITSGGFSVVVSSEWSSGPYRFGFIRNEKAETYTFTGNGVPLASSPFSTGPDGPVLFDAGVQVSMGTNYDISQFILRGIRFTSSQTIFSSSWNFIHNQTSPFVGNAAFTNDTIPTEYGPLVKPWGDHTPAEVEDVSVFVNGVEVLVEDVNPYLGLIRTATPVPRMPRGLIDVDIDYHWFPNPVFPMSGLNSPGLILNKWDRHQGRTATSTSTSTGAPSTSRFPYSIVLGPDQHQTPIHIGHRFIGFESEYTASLNSPTTLLLNQRPWGSSKPYARAESEPVSVTLPEGGLPGSGWVEVGEPEVSGSGVFEVIDDSETSAGYLTKDIDLALPSRVLSAFRVQVPEYSSHGVFSGVGAGFHDNNALYLVGGLEVGGFEHVGILLDPERPDLFKSWKVGPSSSGEIVSGNSVRVSASSTPVGVTSGTRFQILSGTQQGQYTVTNVIRTPALGPLPESVTLIIDGNFPADFNLFGNRDVEVVFESKWSGDSVVLWRLEADTDSETLLFTFGGSLSGSMVLEGGLSAPAPISGIPGLDTGKNGQVFFGSMSRHATNTSIWETARLDSSPLEGTTFSRGTFELVNFRDLEDQGWFRTSPFGSAQVNNTLTIRPSSSGSSGGGFGYRFLDPFLSPEWLSVTEASFRVEDWVGVGDAGIHLHDRKRDVLLATIAYRESGSGSDIIEIPAVSLNSSRPLGDPWLVSGTADVKIDDAFVVFESGILNSLTTVSAEIPLGTEPRTGPKVLRADLRVRDFTSDSSGYIGFRVNVESGVDIGIGWYSETGTDPARVALMSGGSPVGFFDFDWEDLERHRYRVEEIGTQVDIYADDTLLGSLPRSVFTAPVGNGYTARAVSEIVGTSSVVEIHEFSARVEHPLDAKKTLGIWKGGDTLDIDNWWVPRSGPGTVPNSESLDIIEMDWESGVSVKLHLDPGFGLIFERPDIPLPPGYDPDAFATQSTNPTRGWVVVPYRELPFRPFYSGSMRFGGILGVGANTQEWLDFRYRIFTDPLQDYVAPHHMVLNQYNVVHSGEFEFDDTPEVVVVESLDTKTISIWSAHQTASRVFSVIVDGSALPNSTWEFDPESQVVFLDDPLPARNYPVTVVFSPGKPLTKTYVCKQPFEISVTKLNEGTPPFDKSQIQSIIREIINGNRLNAVLDVLNSPEDLLLNTAFQTVGFSLTEGRYEDLEFCTTDNRGQSGLISSICDGPAPGTGFRDIDLSGLRFKEAPGTMFFVGHDPFEGGGVPLFANGGSPDFVGVLNHNPTISNAPSTSGSVSGGVGRRVDSVTFDLQLASSPGGVMIGDVEQILQEFFPAPSDAFPPSNGPDPVSPSGSESMSGSAWYRMEDGTDVEQGIL